MGVVKEQQVKRKELELKLEESKSKLQKITNQKEALAAE